MLGIYAPIIIYQCRIRNEGDEGPAPRHSSGHFIIRDVLGSVPSAPVPFLPFHPQLPRKARIKRIAKTGAFPQLNSIERTPRACNPRYIMYIYDGKTTTLFRYYILSRFNLHRLFLKIKPYRKLYRSRSWFGARLDIISRYRSHYAPH